MSGEENLTAFPKCFVDESNRKFRLYIRQWKDTVDHPDRVTKPSTLPSFTDVTTMLNTISAPTNVPFKIHPSSSHDSVAGESTHEEVGITKATGIVYSPLMQQHCSANSHDYERPARTEKTMSHLKAVGLLDHCILIPPRKIKTKELRLVHTQEHIDYVDQISFFSGLEGKPSISLGQDLYGCEGTSEATRMACGCVAEAAKAIAGGNVRNAYAIIRPPGHHAASGSASGFCFFNNVAVAARVAQKELQRLHPERYTDEIPPRILIFDWDVHHCDGTEDIFFEDPSVLVISIHQYKDGKGHILRKEKSHNTCDTSEECDKGAEELSVDELEKLLKGEATVDSLKPSEAPLEPVSPQVLLTEQDDSDNAMLFRSKRARKEVDYNALATEFDMDDEKAAQAFGVQDIYACSSSSSISGEESMDGVASGPRQLVGDSDGVSEDESSLDEFNSDICESKFFYPGTGHLKSIGGNINNLAKGRNINIPCPTTGMGDLEYMQVVHDIVLPCGHEFHPDMVIISCGFDSARGDLLGSMCLTASGYYAMTKIIAKEFGSVLVALEGGYHVANVARCSEAVLRALLEESHSPIFSKSRMLWFQMRNTINEVKNHIQPYWSCFD